MTWHELLWRLPLFFAKFFTGGEGVWRGCEIFHSYFFWRLPLPDCKLKFPEYQLLRFDPHRYPKGKKTIKPVAQLSSDLIILVFWGIWHVRTGKADTRWPWGHIIISPDPVSSTPRLLPFEEGRIWSSEHFIFIQTCKPSNRKGITMDNYYFKMMPDNMLEGGCDIVPVTDNVWPGAHVWQAIGGALDTWIF